MEGSLGEWSEKFPVHPEGYPGRRSKFFFQGFPETSKPNRVSLSLDASDLPSFTGISKVNKEPRESLLLPGWRRTNLVQCWQHWHCPVFGDFWVQIRVQLRLIKTHQVPDVLTGIISFHSSKSLERTRDYPPFADDKEERLRDLSNVKPLISGRIGIQVQDLQP